MTLRAFAKIALSAPRSLAHILHDIHALGKAIPEDTSTVKTEKDSTIELAI